MSTTLTGIPYVRFIRQARTEQAPLVATQATLKQAVERLKVAPWRQARPGLVISMPTSNPKQTASSDAYDAYKFSGDCPDKSGVQAAFVGMAAYRFKMPDSALSESQVAKIDATINAYSNKFLSAGLRIVSFSSNEEDPLALGSWEFLRGEEGGTIQLREQLKNLAASTKLSTNQTANITLCSGLEIAKYLWVIVQLENWEEIKYEYWIEGAGFLNADTVNVVFDLNGIVADVATETADVQIIVDGNIFSPLLDSSLIVDEGGLVPSGSVNTREFALTTFQISSTAIKNEYTDASAVTAVYAMMAKALNGNVTNPKVSGLTMYGNSANKQAGLTTAIRRGISGTDNPFKQQLYMLVSPVAVLVSLPCDFSASSALITNSSENLVVRGCDMAIDLWWASSKELTLQALGLAATQTAFWYNGSTANDFTKIGSLILPESFDVGKQLSIQLTSAMSGWGTFALSLRILKVKATALAYGSYIGAGNVDITSDSVSGNGWYPELSFVK